jgi:hypothetical protein
MGISIYRDFSFYVGWVPSLLIFSFLLSRGLVRHVRRIQKRQRTVYVVTDRRAIIATEGKDPTVDALPLDRVAQVRAYERANGVGSVWLIPRDDSVLASNRARGRLTRRGLVFEAAEDAAGLHRAVVEAVLGVAAR